MFGILSFWGIGDVKETNFPKGSEVIQEWDGFWVSEETEKPNFQNVPRLFQEQDEIWVSRFPRKLRFQRVLRSFGNKSSHVEVPWAKTGAAIGIILLVETSSKSSQAIMSHNTQGATSFYKLNNMLHELKYTHMDYTAFNTLLKSNRLSDLFFPNSSSLFCRAITCIFRWNTPS